MGIYIWHTPKIKKENLPPHKFSFLKNYKMSKFMSVMLPDITYN